MKLDDLLSEFGLSQKESDVYLGLIEIGPAPARIIARKAGVNRGTTYDVLKKLVDLGLASYHLKGKQHFAAEPPEKLLEVMEDKQNKLQRLKIDVEQKLPELRVMFLSQGGRPAIRVFEGTKGIKKILEDVLNTVSELDEKLYYVYSSATEKERSLIYKDLPQFNDKRIEKKIRVKTISLGAGGETVGLDERKWLKHAANKSSATHEIIYGNKIAHVGLDKSGNPIGVIIDNADIYETQKLIFETLWKKL